MDQQLEPRRLLESKRENLHETEQDEATVEKNKTPFHLTILGGVVFQGN